MSSERGPANTTGTGDGCAGKRLPRYQPLTEAGLEAVHRTTLRILDEVGVDVHFEPALRRLARAGARVDGSRVRFAPEQVAEAVDRAPSRFVLSGRDPSGKHDLRLGEGRTYTGTGGTALKVIDLETGKVRAANLKDTAMAPRLADSLPNVHCFHIPVYPMEMQKEDADVNRFFHAVKNISKHVMGGVYTAEGVRRVIRMAEIIAGGPDALRERPFISFITCVTSPLKFDSTYTELMLEVIEAGLPLAVPAAPVAGSTSPGTLAGTLAQLNAEVLAGVTITQLLRPGHPVLYSAVPTSSDMRTMAFCFGSVEMGLMNAAAAQMARFYELPIYATAGVSESKLPDAQAGFEKAATIVLTALAEADYIHDAVGLLDSGLTLAYEQYVIDDEICGMAHRARAGVEVTGETLAFDIIARVGPGGHFLADPHTLEHMRAEFFFPTLADRARREKWEQTGALDGRERAREKARTLLAEHEPLPLPDGTEEAIRKEIPGIMDP